MTVGREGGGGGPASGPRPMAGGENRRNLPDDPPAWSIRQDIFFAFSRTNA